MNILFADKFQEQYLEDIKNAGHSYTLNPDLTADDLPGAIKGFDAVIVRSTKVTAETIDAADQLKLIVRAGAGTNTIDKPYAAEKGIRVCNTPGKNAVAVAELAMGLLMSIDRNIPDCVADLRAGQWNKKKYSQTLGLHGRSIGIVGLGEIGMAVAERAHAFGMKTYFYEKFDLSPTIAERAKTIGMTELDDPNTLAATCDVMSFHIPANDQTKGMVGTELLSHAKPGAVILNTSRGPIVDDAALIKAMDDQGIRAGLDVYNDEPGTGVADFKTALSQHPNVYGTHHIGASTAQAQNAVAEEVVKVIAAFDKGDILHCVNM